MNRLFQKIIKTRNCFSRSSFFFFDSLNPNVFYQTLSAQLWGLWTFRTQNNTRKSVHSCEILLTVNNAGLGKIQEKLFHSYIEESL